MSAADVAIEAARIAADLLLALVPAPEAKRLLDEAAIRRANAIADAAEREKFGRLGEELAELDDPGDDEPTNPGAQ